MTSKEYKKEAKREDIAGDLLQLVDLESLKIKNKPLIERALMIYLAAKKPLSFADAYALAEMEEAVIEKIMSYDTDFDQFDQLSRVKPL